MFSLPAPDISPYSSVKEFILKDFYRAVYEYNQRVVDCFESTDADIIHCHDWITINAGMDLKRRHGIPLIFTVHSTEYDRSAFFMPQKWVVDIEKRGMSAADKIIAVSRWTKKILNEYYDAPEEKIVPVYNGVNLAILDEKRLEKKGYDKISKTVLFFGRLTRQKGPEFFIRMAKKVLEYENDAIFLVIGKGDMMPELIKQAIECGIADHVKFTGLIPDDEVIDILYDAANIYVLPSVSEPFGISVLEAMLLGVPTIVSRSTGVGESLRNVLRVEYWDTDEMADKVIALLRRAELRETLGKNSSAEARTFTWERCGRDTEYVYRSVVKGD